MPSQDKKPKKHPNHKPEIARLRRIKGQVEGVEKMIVERRYCPDIIHQIRAARAALASLEMGILETHLQHCVTDAIKSPSSSDRDKKIRELLDLFKKN
ncbi:MAG: metal-sensitive transcriptional regulator [Bdellovibrionota bacterium]